MSNITDQELNEVLLMQIPEFREWVESLPDKTWARYDLSAAKLGWYYGQKALNGLRGLIGNCLEGQPMTYRLDVLPDWERTNLPKDEAIPLLNVYARCPYALGGEWISAERRDAWIMLLFCTPDNFVYGSDESPELTAKRLLTRVPEHLDV